MTTETTTATDTPDITDRTAAPAVAESAPAASAPAGSAGAPGAAAPPPGRLRAGELRRRVAEFLAAHPGETPTPGQIARALGRSSGAVGNALGVLASRGEAEQTSTGPVRYRATATTTAAAAAAPGAATPSTAAPSPTTATTASATSVAASTGTAAATGTSDADTAAPGTAATGTGAVSRGRRRRGAAPGAATSAPKATSAADPVVDEGPVTGPVTRPNGQAYHPRTLGDDGMPDVTALRKLRAARIPALMYGPPGTGKTSVIEAAFPDAITVQGDGDTTVGDLVGEYTQNPDGSYVFVHGPLVRAMREGRALFVDDATLIPPTVLAVIYPAMDGRREITIKAHAGEVVRAADGFYVAAGHNPGVHGAVLSDALASRFSAQIRVSTFSGLPARASLRPGDASPGSADIADDRHAELGGAGLAAA